jgi:hypothetical protein
MRIFEEKMKFLRQMILTMLLFLPTGYVYGFTVHCHSLEGNRVQFADTTVAPPGESRKLVRGNDTISGIQLRLTVDEGNKKGMLVTWGNKNIDGQATTTPLFVLAEKPFITLVGIDGGDGLTRYLVSYFPRSKKLLWSMQNNRIAFVQGVILAKQYIADCD